MFSRPKRAFKVQKNIAEKAKNNFEMDFLGTEKNKKKYRKNIMKMIWYNQILLR